MTKIRFPHLGAWLRARRVEKGISQADFSKYLGMTNTVLIVLVEKGYCLVPMARLMRWARGLDIPIAVLRKRQCEAEMLLLFEKYGFSDEYDRKDFKVVLKKLKNPTGG